MVDRGGSSNKKIGGGTFLSVPVNTLSVKNIKRKAARDKRAADSRAPIVNAGINKLGQRIFNALAYQGKAEDLYAATGVRGRDSQIVDSVRKSFSTSRTLTPDGRYKYNFSSAGGQYQVAKSGVDYWNESTQPKSITDYATNAAKADTATEADTYEFYNRRRLEREIHDRIIETGNNWMVDEKAYIDWIRSAPTPEEANRRLEQAEEYMRTALHSVPTYDPNTHTYSTAMQFKSDASLPPWIKATTDNLNLWQYYTTYSHDVVQASADAYRHALDQGREYARNPYKSAFANSEQTGQVDSFLDIAIKAMDPSTVNQDLLGNYFRDYIINPIKAGELKTAAGNALWNMMDTMDIASRGVRALVAGEAALGGATGSEFENANSKFDDYYAKTWEKYGLAPSDEYQRNTYHGEKVRGNDAKFKGQNVYWAHLDGYDLDNEEDLAKIQKAQILFMENGGQELLLSLHPEEATKSQLAEGLPTPTQFGSEREAIIQKLDKVFEDSDIDWRDIYEDINENYYTNKDKRDFKHGLENVKKAYTDVDANFNADTGSMASDIIIETVLDPGMLAGGLAKNITKNGVESAAETAVKKGLRNIHLDEETATRIINNKQVRGAFNQLITSNEGKNIIFRSAKDFENDVDNFILKLKDAKIFSNDETAKVFKDTVTSELMNKNLSVNGAIISTQKFARDALDSKAFKSMYYLDKAIDGVDSAIVKSSFFLPWAGLKGSKALYDTTVNLAAKSELIQKAAARLGMRKAQTLRRLVEDATGEINVTKISDLVQQADSGIHHEKDVRTALQLVVDKYDDVTWSVNDIIRKFSRGEITDDEAFRQVGDLVRNATGGQYQYVQELSGYIDTIAHRYAGDIRSAYGRLTDTFKRLQDVVDRRSESAVDGFIDKVRQAKDIDELKVLFRENMDNSFIMGLRERVLDNTQFDLSMDELNKLVDDVQTGRFADQHIDRDMLKTGIAAQSKLSDRTLRRTINYTTFEQMLHNIGVDWERVIEELELPDNNVGIFEKKISEFMKGWSSQQHVTYNTDDMLKFIDRFQRQLQFRELMKVDVPSEVSALAAHRMVGQFNKLRKQVKQLDLVNLKDVKMIVLPQVDRMAMNIEFRNSKDIQALYGSFYDEVIDPIWKQFRNMTSDEIDLVDSSLFKDIDAIARQKYGFDRTSQLVEEVKALPGFSDDHLHSFLNTLATDFRFRDDMGNIDLTPGGLRRKLEANLRAQTGDSKVGRKQMTDLLQSLSADFSGHSEIPAFLKPYSDEIMSKPVLKTRLDSYIQKDILDPTSYVETQMMFTALADPSVIPEWNALAAKGQAPIAMHINTTGLNSEINSITSVSFRKWVPIDISDDNPLTLERLLDAMDSGETTVIQRRMNDNEFGELTEQVIRKLDMKDCSVENITKRYREIYGIPEGGTYKSEQQMLEEVCAYLNDATIIKEGDEGLRSVAPTLLVHDLDGFNVDYLNNKIMSMADRFSEDSKVYDYLRRVSKSAKDNSCNTYTRLAEQVGDLYYTDEQIEMMSDLLHSYIDDINHFANGYRFNDMQSYSRRIHRMIDELKLKEEAKQLTDREKQLLDSFRNADGEAALKAYDDSVKNIADLGLYPRQFAFLASDVDENFTKAAMDAVGRAAVNTKSRIYVDDILSYFNLETEDGFYAPLEDLRKMNEVSQYIIRTRNRQIVAGAEEFLLPHKADFDRVIQSVIDLANNNSYEATKLSYLQNMRIPDNAVDSYLMAKKLYADHLKYWLDTDNLSSLRTGGKDLDAMKEKLYSMGKAVGFDDPRFLLERDRVYKEACDFVGNHRVRLFDEVTGGAFDSVSDSSLEDVIRQLADEKDEFWRKQITVGQDIWASMKLQNKGEWQVYKLKRQEVDNLYRTTSDAYGEYMQKTYRERYQLRRNIAVLKNRSDDLGQELYKEATDELERINSEGRRLWEPYNKAKEALNMELDKIRKSTQARYDDAELQSAIHYADGYYNLAEMRERQLIEVYEELDAVRTTWERKTEGVLDLLQGAYEPEIYNWAARSDFEKQVLHYRDDVMKSGLDKATHYMEAGSQVTSEMRQLQHMDEYFATAGITRRQDRMLASVYTKTKQLFDILGGTDFLKRDSFHDFLQRASRLNRLHLQQYRLDSLRNADGVFDRTKLLSELVHNGFNMTVFNSYNYTPNEMRELKEFVERIQKSGDDFLSLYEDHTTGNVFVYLNDNCIVSEADGSRWINNSIRLDRPTHDVVPFAEFDELAELMDIPDIEDFRGVYAHLRSCWEDTRILSLGQINGTTGKTLSRSQAESFLQSLPSNMNDWLTSEGLLRDELTRGVVYDPGFVLNEESDMLTDFLGTLHRQAEVAKDDAILINEVFHSTGSVQFSELAQNFSTEELIEYFGENPEYVVCTITGDSKTASGFRVQQLNLNNTLGVENARQMQNTTILPYAAYYDIANYMNRDVSNNIYKQLLGKYMLVYKAFALVKPGTWMRNFIDATAKAAFDNGEGLSGLGNMIQYEAKAARDIGTFGRIMATDPKLLNAANWDIIQSAYKTDMTFEDFELLRGVMDGNRFKSADKYFLSRTTDARGGARIISGENIGLRNLEEKDIREAVKKYLSGDPDLPLSDKEFLDIYLGNVKPDEDTAELYEEMFMKLSNNLRTSNVNTVFDKTIDTMFKPFGQVETLVRYAQTLQLRDNGFSRNQIVRHIHNTQFYNAPTWGKWRQLETIMPFITFKYNNMMYWVRMMDENPRLFRYFEDTYRSVYETTLESALEEGVELDYEDDYGLQSGGIPIGNGKAYFNMGNSFLSAMNDFYNIPHDIDSLNPLLRDTVRSSLYVLGLNSKQFFKDVDLELTEDEVIEHTKELFPGYSLFRDSTKAFKDIHDLCNASEGPSMEALYKTMKVFGVMGIRYSYQQKNGSFSLEEYQDELAKQGKWFDANLGKVVPLSEKNEFGANNPNSTWADVQSYMLVHFGKVWDANQRKFVTMDEYQPGGYNDGFDFENDPDAWDKLCAYMKEQGKRWDNNQRKFVSFPEDYIFGGLNSNTLDWDTKVTLMEEKFGLVWDANQQAFVEPQYKIPGGMNDFSNYSGDEFLSHWNELKSLRLALYGEVYDPETRKFVKAGEPSIILSDRFMDAREREKYDNYYTLLAIPRLQVADRDLHMTDEGLIMNSKGQYVLIGDPEHDAKVFDKFRGTIGYGGRSYNGRKNYSYNKTRRSGKPYHGRTMPRTYIQNYVDNRGYRFREEIKYNYQYTSPNPGGKLNYLIYPPRHYPYGGGYNKFSFNSRY